MVSIIATAILNNLKRKQIYALQVVINRASLTVVMSDLNIAQLSLSKVFYLGYFASYVGPWDLLLMRQELLELFSV